MGSDIDVRKLRSLSSIAAQFGIDRSSIFRWRKAGLIQCVLIDNTYFIDPAVFSAWFTRWINRAGRRGRMTRFQEAELKSRLSGHDKTG